MFGRPIGILIFGMALGGLISLSVIYFCCFSDLPIKYLTAPREVLIDALFNPREDEQSDLAFAKRQAYQIMASEARSPQRSFAESIDPVFWENFLDHRKTEILELEKARRTELGEKLYSQTPTSSILLELAWTIRGRAVMGGRISTVNEVDKDFQNQLLYTASRYALGLPKPVTVPPPTPFCPTTGSASLSGFGTLACPAMRGQ